MKKKKIKSIIGIFIVFIVLIYLIFQTWANTPEQIVKDIYQNGYDGDNPEILKFAEAVQEYKNELYDMPNVTKSYNDGIWQVKLEFYLYDEKEGSVLGIRRLDIRLKAKREFPNLMKPEIAELIEMDYIKTDTP